MQIRHHQRQHGVVAVLAMMFIVIFASLAAAMAIVSQGNVRTADTYQHVNKSLAAAETGMRFASYRLDTIASDIQTVSGVIDVDMADIIWPTLRDAIISDMGSELHSNESYALDGEKITLGSVPVGAESGAPTFQVIIERHPLVGEDYGSLYYQRDPYNINDGTNNFTADGFAVAVDNPVDGRWVRLRSEGDDQGYTRAVQMEYRIDKKVRFAILSRNRVMIGRNVMIRGSIGSRYTLTNYEHGHPVQMRDNFTGLDAQLDTWLDAFENYLADNDADGDNRVNLADDTEAANLVDAATYDRNGDGFVDAYDFFLLKYDDDADGALTTSEFTATGGGLVDEQLWQLINEYKYPAGTLFRWDDQTAKIGGTGSWIDISEDMDVINAFDGYAKISGEVLLEATKADWEVGAADGAYQKFFEGPIHPDPTKDSLTFGMNGADMAAFTPSSFDTSTYKAMATGDFAGQVIGAEPRKEGVTPQYTPPSAATIEETPFGSLHPYDYYMRPVYKNYTFRDVKIPMGTNAVFKNCRFIGVTFIETATDNADPNFNYAGMQEPDGSIKFTNIAANVDGNPLTDTKGVSNNLRFHNCTFEGMLASDSPDAYTHVRNKVQVTGKANFKIEKSNELSDAEKAFFKRSTLMLPQLSVDMGTFLEPNDDGEWTRLDGTIVAGVFDIRGTATIDGSIITTYEPLPGEGGLAQGGNPAAFNTTIGYFESTAGDGEGEIPAGGYGKIIIRYDPTRQLPDGINGPIELRGELDTYYEGK